MPYANNQDVRIYYEVEGEGPPLVLAHGSSGSTEQWHRYGYSEKLNKEYRLIIFDARGHGKSDKPHDAESYRYSSMAGDALAVMNDLGIEKAHYWGYSMGSSFGFRLATQSKNRFHSFIFGGISPYRGEEEIKMLTTINNDLKVFVTDPAAYLAGREAFFGRPLTAEEKSQILANDPKAVLARSTAGLTEVPPNNEELALIDLPCLVYCGDADPCHAGGKEMVDHLPKGTFVSLPGLGHVPAFAQSDLALPHAKEFLAEVDASK